MIAIDPGAAGGIVYDDREGTIHLCPMPDTPGDIVNLLKTAIFAQPIGKPRVCVIEDTGTYMPGNSGPAAVTFGWHCGGLEYALLALEVRQERVKPKKWMDSLGALPKAAKGSTAQQKAKAKTERKNAIKAIMQQRYPDLRITLKTSDALALYDYAKRNGL